jgi:hypothetical protein
MANLTGFLDELNTSTQRHIVPGIVDQVFKNDPLLAYMKKNNLQKFPGGTQIQENFIYDSLPYGGAFADGATFTMAMAQVETGATFIPKNYAIPVTISKMQAQVYNKGPEAVFRLVDSRLQNAALTMSAMLAIALYNHGTGTRVLELNGLAEVLNDGTNNSWTGAAYSTYGTLSRSTTGGSVLKSKMTGPTANVAGPITYKILEEAYNSIVIGDEYPNLMVTTNLGMSYIKEKFQPQWRVETQDPKIGFNGVKFNQAMIIQSQYAPGSEGVNDANLGHYLAPSSQGETLFYLNTKYWRLWVTDDPEFGFGFTGFKPAQDTLVVGGQYLYVGNVTCQSPRLNRHLYNITG